MINFHLKQKQKKLPDNRKIVLDELLSTIETKRKELSVIENKLDKNIFDLKETLSEKTKSEIIKNELDKKTQELNKAYETARINQENNIKVLQMQKDNIDGLILKSNEELEVSKKDVRNELEKVYEAETRKDKERQELKELENKIKFNQELFKDTEKQLSVILPIKKQAEDVIKKEKEIIQEKELKIQELVKKEEVLTLFESRIKSYYKFVGKTMPDFNKYLE